MTISSLFGYLLIVGLAIAFYYLGSRGFSRNGLPLSKRYSLTGRPGQVVGGVLILVGTSILGTGFWDLLETHLLPAKQPNPPFVQPLPPPQEAEQKKLVRQPQHRPVGDDGIFLDIRETWSRKFGVLSRSLYRDPSGSVYFGDPNGPIIVTGFTVFWSPGEFIELPEPNAPFGLGVSAENPDAALNEIRRFKNLNALSLSLTKLSNQGLENLKELPKLEWLLLYSVKSVDGDFSAIGGCKHVVYLQLGSTNVTDASLKEISRLDNLKELILFSTPISDTGLQDVAKLDKLKVLNLQSTKVTDAGMKYVGELKQLRKLDLNGTAVTDEGLKYLAGLEHLEDLNLVLTKITDKGLRELTALKRLQTLHLLATNVTDQGVAELKKALPDLKLGIR